jgi:hypothetical protein
VEGLDDCCTVGSGGGVDRRRGSGKEIVNMHDLGP